MIQPFNKFNHSRVSRPACLLALALGALIASPTAHAHHGRATLDARTEIAPFVRETVKEYGLDAEYVRRTLADAKSLGNVIDAMTRPAEGKPWHEYRQIFIKDKRIASGVEFWREHASTLTRAQETYGVPARMIVAIIGVETWFGRYKGKDRVLDSLATLAFRFPRRAKFFRSELKEFLKLAQEEAVDPLVTKGSYAGAMGWPQFISSSYRRYAVDFDEDGRRDLVDSPADAIGSVANYLASHGWQPGGPVGVRASVTGKAHEQLLRKDSKVRFRLAALDSHGVALERVPAGGLDAAGKTALLRLDGAQGDEHWVTFKNFYVVTRYNHSALYAMAVYQLSELIAAEYGAAAR